MTVSVGPMPSHRLWNSAGLRPPWCLALYSRRPIFHTIFLLSTTTTWLLQISSIYNHGDDRRMRVYVETTPKQHPCTLHIRDAWSCTEGHPQTKTTCDIISATPHATPCATAQDEPCCGYTANDRCTTPLHVNNDKNTKSTIEIDEESTPWHAARPLATQTPCGLCCKRLMVLNFRPFQKVVPLLSQYVLWCIPLPYSMCVLVQLNI